MQNERLEQVVQDRDKALGQIVQCNSEMQKAQEVLKRKKDRVEQMKQWEGRMEVLLHNLITCNERLDPFLDKASSPVDPEDRFARFQDSPGFMIDTDRLSDTIDAKKARVASKRSKQLPSIDDIFETNMSNSQK